MFSQQNCNNKYIGIEKFKNRPRSCAKYRINFTNLKNQIIQAPPFIAGYLFRTRNILLRSKTRNFDFSSVNDERSD